MNTITIDTQWINLIVGAVLPLLVGLITKRVTSSSIQRALLVLFSAIAGTLTNIAQAGGSFVLRDALIATAVTYFTAQTSYSSVLKPYKIADTVAAKTDGIGVVIKADPAKEAALSGDVTTPAAADSVGVTDPVVEVDDPSVEVGDEASVQVPGDEPEPAEEPAPAPTVESVQQAEPMPAVDPLEAEMAAEEGDVIPYDEEPIEAVPVVDVDALPVEGDTPK